MLVSETGKKFDWGDLLCGCAYDGIKWSILLILGCGALILVFLLIHIRDMWSALDFTAMLLPWLITLFFYKQLFKED